MADNFENFIVKFRDGRKILRKLPMRESALESFYDCLGWKGTQDMWGRIFKVVADSKDSKCYNYARCNLRSVPHPGMPYTY